MKTTMITLAALALLLPGPVSAVMVGDTKDAVLAELGSPSGYLGTSDREIFTYERGRVVLEAGIVESAELISEDEALRRRLQREAEEAARLERERERWERLMAEGAEMRLRWLADPDFTNASPAKRLAFWQRFREVYPMVELGDEYGAALRERELELEAENAAIAAERRIRELEMRLVRAEADAANASHYPEQDYATVPVVRESRTYRRSGGIVHTGTSGCSHGRKGRCRSTCQCKPRVEPLPRSAGDALHRPQGNMVGVNVWTGKPVYEQPVCTTPRRQTRPMHTAKVGSPTPSFVASRPWITSGSTVVPHPVSRRSSVSASACFSL